VAMQTGTRSSSDFPTAGSSMAAGWCPCGRPEPPRRGMLAPSGAAPTPMSEIYHRSDQLAVYGCTEWLV
jgi:hypothetical protein